MYRQQKTPSYRSPTDDLFGLISAPVNRAQQQARAHSGRPWDNDRDEVVQWFDFGFNRTQQQAPAHSWRPRDNDLNLLIVTDWPSALISASTSFNAHQPKARAPRGGLGTNQNGRLTHLDTPQSRSAVVHGGVRPKWLQGSRVTYAVPPRARSPAWRIAQTCNPHARDGDGNWSGRCDREKGKEVRRRRGLVGPRLL